jgi:hypothetical protein
MDSFSCSIRTVYSLLYSQSCSGVVFSRRWNQQQSSNCGNGTCMDRIGKPGRATVYHRRGDGLAADPWWQSCLGQVTCCSCTMMK